MVYFTVWKERVLNIPTTDSTTQHLALFFQDMFLYPACVEEVTFCIFYVCVCVFVCLWWWWWWCVCMCVCVSFLAMNFEVIDAETSFSEWW